MEIDMCKSMEEYKRKAEVTGAIKLLQGMGAKEVDIIAAVVKQFAVTADYVKALMQPKAI